MRALIINLPKQWKTIVVSLLLVIGLILAGGYYFKTSNYLIPAEDLLTQALNQAFEAQSYRYTMVSQLYIDGKNQTWSDVTGEKADPHDLHLRGTMVNTPIELYQVGDTSYNKDPFTNRWYTVKGYDLTRQEILMMEVNPLANFNFKEVIEVNNIGKEKVQDKNCWVLECTADLENQLLEVLWQDFRFQFWVDREDHLLRKGQLTARSKTNPESLLTITTEFKDYNQPIQFEVPQV